jgi:hypothetical protein
VVVLASQILPFPLLSFGEEQGCCSCFANPKERRKARPCFATLWVAVLASQRSLLRNRKAQFPYGNREVAVLASQIQRREGKQTPCFATLSRQGRLLSCCEANSFAKQEQHSFPTGKRREGKEARTRPWFPLLPSGTSWCEATLFPLLSEGEEQGKGKERSRVCFATGNKNINK